MLRHEERLENRRKSERIRITVPVKVEGRDLAGNPFSEETVIMDLNSRGAGFRLNSRVAAGDEITLLIEPSCCRRRKTARVVRVGEGPRSRDVGVTFAY